MTLRDTLAADLLAAAIEPVKSSVRSGLIPGAALGIALKRGGEAMAALGFAVKEPATELLDLDTVFDLASLTKVMLTTPAILALVDRGAISLDDTLGALLPGIPAGAAVATGEGAASGTKVGGTGSGTAAGCPASESNCSGSLATEGSGCGVTAAGAGSPSPGRTTVSSSTATSTAGGTVAAGLAASAVSNASTICRALW